MTQHSPFLVAALAALGLASCHTEPAGESAPAGDKPGTAEKAATAEKAPAAGDKAAVATGGDKACDDYVTAACEKLGATGEPCQRLKEAAPLLPPAACTAAKADLDYTVNHGKDMKSPCDELVGRLCKDLGDGSDTCKLVKEKTPQFPADRCKNMMQNYDQVLGELKTMEAQNQPLSPDLQTRQLTEGAPAAFGPQDAKVTVVEYSDFQCPYCAGAAKTVKQLKDKYGDKVRFVFRNYPLPFHQSAMPAAQAAAEAKAQGKFWEYHDLLFANQQNLDRENLEKLAGQAGVDVGKLKKALDDKSHEAEVKADMDLAQAVAVQGTPTMFIGGKRVQNPADFDGLSKQIDEALGGGAPAAPPAGEAPKAP